VKAPLLSGRLGIAPAVLLLGGVAFGQATGGCGEGIYTQSVPCYTDPNRNVTSQWCGSGGSGGSPDLYCYELNFTCSETGNTYYTANLIYDADCDGGGGSGCENGCECDDGSCSFACCVEARSPGTVASSRHPIRGGYYRNGKVYDEPLFRSLGVKETTGLAGVPDLVDASLTGENLGGESVNMPALILAGVCGAAPALCAQQAAVPIASLQTTAKIEVQNRRATLSGQAMCDGAGNVYLRQLDAEISRDRTRSHQLPIQEITSAGAPAGGFRITDAFPADVIGMGVFVNHKGDAYQVAMMRGTVYVVEFGHDGSVKTRTKMETGDRRFTNLSQLAVFGSGEYLLAGETGKNGHTPFTAVFAADGRLVKEIYEPEDDEARQKAELGDLDYASNNMGNQFVGLGGVDVGSDGNVYLLRRTPLGFPTLIYVISPAGEVVRKLRIEAGDSDLVAEGIKSYGGRLAIGFGRRSHTDRYQVKVIDLQGNTIADYVGALIGNDTLALACYNSEGLTMLPYFANPSLYLLKAKLP
jgi:hypothetical protein